jgi:hypothetical protein
VREVRLRPPRGILRARVLGFQKRETAKTRRLLRRRAEEGRRSWPWRRTNQRTGSGLPFTDVSPDPEGHWKSKTSLRRLVVRGDVISSEPGRFRKPEVPVVLQQILSSEPIRTS